MRLHRRVRQLLLAVGAVLVLGVGVLLLGARLSLDTEYGHMRGVEMLLPLSPGTSEGLVQIRARDLFFRARVAGLVASRARQGSRFLGHLPTHQDVYTGHA